MSRSILAAASLSLLVLLPAAASARSRHHAAGDKAPPPATAMVTLTPAPGVSFQIPENWIACEDDTQRLLRPASDPMNFKPTFCAQSSNVPTKVRVFDPRPLHLLSVIFNWHANQPLTEAAIDAIDDADLDKIRQKVCDVETKPLVDQGVATASCDVATGMLAGHRALVSTLIESRLPDTKNKFTIVSFELAYPQGYVQIQFSYPLILESIVKPLQKTIEASVQISSVAEPPATPPHHDDDAQTPDKQNQDAPREAPPKPEPSSPSGTPI